MNSNLKSAMKTFVALTSMMLACFMSFADENPYSVQYTVNGYAGTEALTNFPVLVRLAANSPVAFTYDDCAANGSDIRFKDAEGNLIPHEIDTWTTSGESLIWVCVPVVTNGASFTMYYGANNPGESATGLWSSYVGVWHMTESDGTVADATGHGLVATPMSNTVNSVATTGAVGNGRQTATSAAKGYLSVTNYNSFGLGGTFTMSGWVKMSACTAYPRMFSRKANYTDANGWEIEMKNGSMVNFTARGSGNSSNVDKAFSTTLQNAWSHLAFVYSGATLTVYQNGSQVASGTIAAATDNGLALSFGCDSDGSETYLQGAFDECRLMGGAASADWVKAEYDTVTGADFLTAGPCVSYLEPNLSISAVLVDSGAVNISATIDSIGEGAASCDLYFAYAPAGDVLPDWTLVAPGLTAGDSHTRKLTGLVENTTYDYAFMASNNCEKTTVKSGTFFAGIGFPRPDKNVAEFSRGAKFTVTGYNGSEVLTNFPVLVRLSAGSPAGFSYADFYNPGDVAGADLCFLDADGNAIPHEIDTWNTAGESLVWVTIPRMTNGVEFAMWYRSSKNGSVVCPANAWEDYTGVWHLGEGGDGVQSVYDSTTNTLTGVTHANSLAVASGRIGAARRNSTKSGNAAANGRILVSLGDENSRERAVVDALVPEFSASLWFSPKANADWSFLMARKGDDAMEGWGIQFGHNTDFQPVRIWASLGKNDGAYYRTFSPGSPYNNLSGMNKVAWRQVHVVYGSDGYVDFYYDGGAYHTRQQVPLCGKNFESNLSEILAKNGSADLAFGGMSASGYGSFNGEMDEIRLRKGKNSSDWVKAEYDAVVDATFVNGGAVVSLAETPRPIATLALSDSSAKYAQFSGSIGNCGGDATECTVYVKVWETADTEPSAWTLLEGSLEAGDTFTKAVTGLDPETAYSWKLKAVNNLETPTDSEIAEGTFTTGGTGSGGTGGERYRVGNDYVHVFEIEQGTDVTEFEFTPPGYVSSIKALVVAGGGPGGYQRGGGGGAGGLIYNDALAVTGGATYTINVGTGGVASASASAYGSNGGNSSIVGTDVSVIAEGGGAGGNASTVTAGVAGGSGGGGGGIASGTAAVGGSASSGQGNSGGSSAKQSTAAVYVAGGGGGAGRPGGAGSIDSPPSAGSGGQGFLTDISGTPTWYAGGGGGGGQQVGTASNLGSPGGGGDGGGGRGGMAVPNGTVNPSFGPAAVAGQNGLGGGGGGGSDVSGFYEGANGGNGIVIVRYTVEGTGAGSAEPVVSLTGATYAGDLKITGTYRVAWAGEGESDADVYIKWGYSANSLTHSTRVAQDAIGTGSFEITVPVDQTTIYLRAMADNGTAQGLSDEIVPIYVPEYSGVVPGDTTIPVLGVVSVSAVDGLFARLSGTVTSFGTAGAGEDPITGCEVYALVGTSDNVSRMAAQDAMPVTANEPFSLAISNLTVATTYYWCLEARNSAGVAVATQVGSFTTLPAHSVANAVTANNAQRTVNLSGSLAQIGAGKTVVSVRWKEGGDEWGDWSVVTNFDGTSASTAFNTSHKSESWNTTIAWQVSFSNQCVTAEGEPVGDPWVTTQSGNFTTGDNATYTWQAVDDDWNGSWTNAAHWACSQTDRRDYPYGGNETIVFNNNTVATVEVPGDYSFKDWSIAKSGVNVTFVGEGAATSALRGNIAGGAVANSSWTFSAMTLAESNGLNFGNTNSVSSTANNTITFKDGAVGSTGSGYLNLLGSNVWLVVESGAAFNSDVYNGTIDGGMRLDSGTVSGAGFRTDYNWTATTNEWVVFKGEAPRLVATASFRNESATAENLQNADTTFLFSVPRNGWAASPLYAEYSTSEKFGGILGSGGGGYVIAVDPESPVLSAAGNRTVQLVEWKSGIDTSHVRFATEPPANVTLSWTYGWPSTLDAPENEGDAPTGVKAAFSGRAKPTMLLVW